MPTETSKEAHTLEDFAEFLAALTTEGFVFSVIGGCAVAAYAHLQGETLTSVDLDLYLPGETLYDLLEWAPRRGAKVLKHPQPRSLQVAELEAIVAASRR